MRDVLVREPLKENPLPGESKTYDSVQVSILHVLIYIYTSITMCDRNIIAVLKKELMQQ